MHQWNLVLSTRLLHLDSRLVPKAEETNLNFLQLAYSWVPCVSKTSLIMWIPDVFSTSHTTSKDPSWIHFPKNESKSPLLLLELCLHHWKQTVSRRCWNNSFCVNSVWRLASHVAELGTLKLNMNRRSGENVLQKKLAPILIGAAQPVACGMSPVWFLLARYLCSWAVIIPSGSLLSKAWTVLLWFIPNLQQVSVLH